MPKAPRKLSAKHKTNISKARQNYELGRKRKDEFLREVAALYLSKQFPRISKQAIAKIVREMNTPEAIMNLCTELNRVGAK